MTPISSVANATSGLAAPETALNGVGQTHIAPTAAQDSLQVGPEAAAQLSEEALKHVVAQANAALAATTSNQLHFSVDQATGAYVVKLVDQQTGKTLHQFPTEKILAVAQAIMNMEEGSLIDHEV